IGGLLRRLGRRAAMDLHPTRFQRLPIALPTGPRSASRRGGVVIHSCRPKIPASHVLSFLNSPRVSPSVEPRFWHIDEARRLHLRASGALSTSANVSAYGRNADGLC